MWLYYEYFLNTAWLCYIITSAKTKVIYYYKDLNAPWLLPNILISRFICDSLY